MLQTLSTLDTPEDYGTKLLAASFGDTSPIKDATNLVGIEKTEADQLNRRIEFILSPR